MPLPGLRSETRSGSAEDRKGPRVQGRQHRPEAENRILELIQTLEQAGPNRGQPVPFILLRRGAAGRAQA